MKGSVKHVRGAKLRTETTAQESKITQVVGHSSSTKEVNGQEKFPLRDGRSN